MVKKYLGQIILRYFKALAILQLKKNPQAIIIGITGSSGKTSTRLSIVSMLQGRGVVKHSAHANSESGIPLNILGLAISSYTALDWLRLIIMAPIKLLTNWEKFNYYVVEMGIDGPDEPKNMAYLLKIIKPNVGIVLNARLVHSAAFDHLVKDNNPERREAKVLRLIAREKMLLLKSLAKQSVAVVNIDQKELLNQKRDIEARIITFGKSEKANVQIVSAKNSAQGFKLVLKYQDQLYRVQLNDLYTPNYAYTFAASVAALAGIGIPPSLSIKGLSAYKSPAGRMRVFPGIHQSRIIDSSYNASPETMLESLKFLNDIGGRSKKIAVLGDMRELGLTTKSAHKKLADWAMNYCDEVVLYGELTKEYVLPVLQSQKFTVHHFDDINLLNKYLTKVVKPKSTIMIKGSQNTIMLERAVAAILANKSDIDRLCRRGKYWDKIRSSLEK